MTADDQYTPTDEQMQADWHAYITTPDEDNYYYDALSSEEADARWSRWLAAHDARVRRDAWDACYHQMVTAPARGVTVTEKSNPYAPERRVTP